jgi:predicted ATPase
MITRLYADNFRTLSNFELRLERLNLLLGTNAAGKTSILELLRLLQGFVTDRGLIRDLFPATTLTRWEKRTVQRYELDLADADRTFTYKLEIEHRPERDQARVINEEVVSAGRHLFRFHEGEVQLYRDDFSPGPRYPADWTQSALATLAERADNQRVTSVKRCLRQCLIVKMNPAVMVAESDREDSRAAMDLSNFASWYRWLSQEHQDIVFDLTVRLRELVEGFHSFVLQGSERLKTLQAKFSTRENGSSLTFRFDELSDGQRVLLVLHLVVEFARRQGYSVWLDEPENFLALSEVQPWMNELWDAVGEHKLTQAVLVSHHPVLINHLAASNGIWVERAVNAPTRVRRIEASAPTLDAESTASGSVPLADLIERGWLYE